MVHYFLPFTDSLRITASGPDPTRPMCGKRNNWNCPAWANTRHDHVSPSHASRSPPHPPPPASSHPQATMLRSAAPAKLSWQGRVAARGSNRVVAVARGSCQREAAGPARERPTHPRCGRPSRSRTCTASCECRAETCRTAAPAPAVPARPGVRHRPPACPLGAVPAV